MHVSQGSLLNAVPRLLAVVKRARGLFEDSGFGV